MLTIAIAALVLVAPVPGEVLSTVPGPAGFELADGQQGLDFDDYALLEPDAVDHVDPASAAADGMIAAVDIWASAGETIMLRQVIEWAETADAEAYVEQAGRVADAEGLDSVEARFLGAVEYVGEDADGVTTHLLTWAQGRHAVSVEVFSADARDLDDVHGVADALAAEIEASGGVDVRTASDAAESGSGGGIPITTVLLWLVIIGGAIWLFVKLRRKLRGSKPSQPATDVEPADTDEMIERARARRRAEAEVDAIPDPTDDWTPPDDW